MCRIKVLGKRWISMQKHIYVSILPASFSYVSTSISTCFVSFSSFYLLTYFAILRLGTAIRKRVFQPSQEGTHFIFEHKSATSKQPCHTLTAPFTHPPTYTYLLTCWLPQNVMHSAHSIRQPVTTRIQLTYSFSYITHLFIYLSITLINLFILHILPLTTLLNYSISYVKLFIHYTKTNLYLALFTIHIY